MNVEELNMVLGGGENVRTEFKTSFNEEVIVTRVAFANTNGGKAVTGINNKKEVAGIMINDESCKNWINAIKGKTQPSLIPDFGNFQHGFRVIVSSKPKEPAKKIQRKESGLAGGQTGGQTHGSGYFTDMQLTVLELIKQNHRITRKELAKKLNISESAIQKHINQLKIKKVL